MPHVKKALGLLVVCSGFAIPVQTASAAPFDAYVTEAATRANIPPAWITAVMHAESQGDASVVSPKGAMGLMQIMPDTWREIRATLNLGADPYDPRDSITAGATYLRWLHEVSIGSVISNTGRSTNSVSRLPNNTPSGSPLFVCPFASQTTGQGAPEVMPVSDHVMRLVAPPHGLFVPVSQRSAP